MTPIAAAQTQGATRRIAPLERTTTWPSEIAARAWTRRGSGPTEVPAEVAGTAQAVLANGVAMAGVVAA